MVKKIKLDFSKVEERSGWNTKGMPEGLHAFKVESVEETQAGDGTDMLVFALRPTSTKFKNRLFPFYCKLQQNQYWKLRDLLVAAGIAVPKKALTVDPNKVVGKLVAGEVEDESNQQYAGRSTINGIYDIATLEDDSDADSDEDADEADEDDEEYEADEAEDDEDEDEDEDEADDERAEELEGMGLPALRKIAKELDIVTTGLKKPELIEAILEAEDEVEEDDEAEDDLDDEDLDDEELDDEDLDDEEEEEEEPAPRRRAAASKKPTAKAPAKKAAPAAAGRRVVKRR